MNTMTKSYSVEFLGKRKREELVHTNSDNDIKKNFLNDIELLYDKIMTIQIRNTIQSFSFFGDNRYFLSLNKVYNNFDGNKEIKYFIENIDRFGFNFLGGDKNKTKLYFEKKNDDNLIFNLVLCL
jgi:hypothetical protein